MSPEGRFPVHWTEPEKLVNAEFASASSETASVRAKRGRPMASKLVKKMQK